MDFLNWSEFLNWLSTPNGVPVVAGILLSVIAEYVPAYNSIPAKWKRVVFFFASLVVPVGAAGLGVLTDGWPATWVETFWPAIVTGILVFASGTMAHLIRLPNAPIVPPSEPLKFIGE